MLSRCLVVCGLMALTMAQRTPTPTLTLTQTLPVDMPTVPPSVVVRVTFNATCTTYQTAFGSTLETFLRQQYQAGIATNNQVCEGTSTIIVTVYLDNVAALPAGGLSAQLQRAVATSPDFTSLRTTLGTFTLLSSASIPTCTQTGITAVRRQPSGACEAISCASGYSLSGTTCKRSDDDLADWEIALIVIGCVAFVVLVAVIVLCVVRKPRSPATEPENGPF